TRFVVKHSGFGSPAAFAFLPADFFDAGAFDIGHALLKRLNFIEQQSPSDKSVEPLLPGRLTFHAQTSRTMQQHDAGGGLVHVLAAVPTAAHEAFLEVSLAHAQ